MGARSSPTPVLRTDDASAKVYLLWFVREEEGMELLIGVYETQAAAKAAIQRLKCKPGFIDSPERFQVEAYRLGQDNWTEGFVRSD